MRRLIPGGFFSSGSPPRSAAAITDPQRATPAQLAAEAAQRAEDADNRVFRLERPAHVTGPVKIAAFGCHGTGDENQAEVANALSSYLRSGDNRADFAALLGDLCYDWGAKSATDPNLRKCNYDMYPKRSASLRIPYFNIAGNHDHNFQKVLKQAMAAEKGIPRVMHEIAHTFIDPETNAYKPKINRLYNEALSPDEQLAGMRTLKLEDLIHYQQFYNFPRRYYSLVIEDLQLFMMDTNTFALDCLAYLTDPSIAPTKNQAAWLAHEVKRANTAKRTVMLMTHQSLYTAGERGFHDDKGLYIDKAELIAALVEKLNFTDEELTYLEGPSYNALLLKCLIKMGFAFDREKFLPHQCPLLCIDTVVSAHDHNMGYRNNRKNPNHPLPLCQIIAGGGGGKLQNRYQFTDQEDMGIFLKQKGFVMISHTPGRRAHLDFEFVTSNGEHVLRFNNLSNQPLITFSDKYTPDDKLLIQLFFIVVERAINKYLIHIGDNQFTKNMTHGHEGVNRAHDVWAYIRHADPKTNMMQIIQDVYNKTKWEDGSIKKSFTAATDNSLITVLDREIQAAYGQNMALFAVRPVEMKDEYRQTISDPAPPIRRIESSSRFTH